MSIPVLRTAEGWWVQQDGGRAARMETDATTTGAVLAERAAMLAAREATETVAVTDLALLSPVTAPCRVVANMTNYRSHVRDAGMDPATIPLTFFRKTSGSLTGPHDTVVRPSHVTLLDYEVEVGLVVGRPLSVGDVVDEATLAEHVAALVICNDVSARDVQLPKTQFFEGKSYPGFTPVGPHLLVLEDGEIDRFGDLRLRLWVNGDLRQDAAVGEDMIYSPLQSLQALSRFQHLDAGDLLLTGTPVGTALSAPAKVVEIIGSLLPPALKWRLFLQKQATDPRYLQDGDVMELAISTPDGALDLGTQRTPVRWEP